MKINLSGLNGSLVVLVSLSASVMCDAASRKYKFYLDPLHAEEQIAQLGVKPRLVGEEWVKIVGERKAEHYKVVRGDTLWSISRKLFKSPFLWRKVWEVNAPLGNPHRLEIGNVLTYYNETPSRGLASTNDEHPSIPIIKLRPRGFADISDQAINRELKNRSLPPVVVIPPDVEPLGVIQGAYTEKDYLGHLDEVYLSMPNREAVKVGDRFGIAHMERKLKDPNNYGKFLGILLQYVGEVKIINLGEKMVKAEIISHRGLIRREDWIVPAQSPVQWLVQLDPPNTLDVQIVTGEEEEFSVFTQGQTILLNKGETEGMKKGFVFRVYENQDLKTKNDEDVEPYFKGEIFVIHVDKISSIGYILKSERAITKKDRLLPRQVFPNPPPRPRKETQNLDIE